MNTIGRVLGLDLHLVDVEVGKSAVIALTDSVFYDAELLLPLVHAEHASTELKLAVGASVDFRGYRVSLKSAGKSLLPTGSQNAVVVVDLIAPEDRWFSELEIGQNSTPLHPKLDHSADWHGIEIAAPKVVLTENQLIGRDHFHGLGPSSARVMIAGTWHLTATEIKDIEKRMCHPVDECAVMVVVGPGKDDRQSLRVAQLLANIGDKEPRRLNLDEEPEEDPHANHPTSWGGYFTVDLGDKIATSPNATGVFRVWAELGAWKSSELQIELKPQ